jgi:Fanconi anemia group M protein
VIFYEPIPSEIRYIQRRGRTGRKAPGEVTILATNDTLDMIYQYASRRRTERMKKIAETLSSKLHPILRSHNRPPPRPMTNEELRELESVAVKVEVEPEVIKTEEESVKELSKAVKKATKSLYMKLLERGVSGGSVKQLAFEMEPEGLNTSTIKSAINSLMKDGLVTEKSQGTYVVTSVLKSRGPSYEIIVEKISPGSATVLVNNKWRARLTSENYNGPRNLIKKNSRFHASAELYESNGVLCIRVKEVIKKIA